MPISGNVKDSVPSFSEVQSSGPLALAILSALGAGFAFMFRRRDERIKQKTKDEQERDKRLIELEEERIRRDDGREVRVNKRSDDLFNEIKAQLKYSTDKINELQREVTALRVENAQYQNKILRLELKVEQLTAEIARHAVMELEDSEEI